MPVVSDPRTYDFARIPNSSCMILANSSVAWSGTSAATYAAAKGIPSGNIKSYALGTSATWSVGANPKTQTDTVLAFCEWLRAEVVAGGYRAILIGPACPARVAILGGDVAAGGFSDSTYGYPAFSHLVAGCKSFTEELFVHNVLSQDYDQLLAFNENGASRYKWAKTQYRNGSHVASAPTPMLWNTSEFEDLSYSYLLGLTDVRETANTYSLNTTSLTSHASASTQTASLPSGIASQFYGNSAARWLPVGRIGWASWAGSGIAETESFVQDIIDSSDAADAYVAAPGPLFFMLQSVSGTDIVGYAGLANTAAAWGYTVEYCYRVSSPNSTAQTLCPTGSAAFPYDDVGDGTITDYSIYLLSGSAVSTDDASTSGEVGYNTFLPEPGADYADFGPSGGYKWAIRGFTRGAAAGNMDITHRNTGEQSAGWIGAYKRLTGASGLELQPLGPRYCGCPSGDPLHRAFHFDPAGELTLLEKPPSTAISYGLR